MSESWNFHDPITAKGTPSSGWFLLNGGADHASIGQNNAATIASNMMDSEGLKELILDRDGHGPTY